MAERYEYDARSRLARTLDGVSIESAETTRAVYRAALAAMEPRFLKTLNILRRLAPEDVCLGAGYSDDLSALLKLMGVRTRTGSGSLVGLSRARLAAIGCFGPPTPPSGEVLEAYFRQGGVLVTSDRALERMEYPISGIYLDDPAPMRRGRIVISRETTRGWDHLALAGSALATAVMLDAGHIPIDVFPEAEPNVSVLAHDVLGGRPMAIVVPVENGWLVHSVAHWHQLPPGLPTDLERRTIGTLARHFGIAGVPPDASFGLFMAARTMLFTLLSGLEIAFQCRRLDSIPEDV